MKLYVITRADLPPGARAAQAVHTAYAFCTKHPEPWARWYEDSNNIVVLEVEDERALLELLERAELQGVFHASFREPDFDNTVTGIALESAGGNLVSNLRLALRDVA